MKERLLEFLRAENKSSAQFAEEIGVQPSGISHIISGRNNPSLDFVLKMLEKYKFISTDWLLFGKGSMYKEPKMQTLFDEENNLNLSPDINVLQKEAIKSDQKSRQAGTEQPDADNSINLSETRSSIARIVWFYADNSFEEFFPRH